jgi:hypothetical protein
MPHFSQTIYKPSNRVLIKLLFLPPLAPFFVFLAYSGQLQRLQISQPTPIQFLSLELPKVKRIVQIPQLIHHDLRELAPESLHAMLS